MATATACRVLSALSATVFIAIHGAEVNNNLDDKIPTYVAKAVIRSDLSRASLEIFIDASSSRDQTALTNISGLKPQIATAGAAALSKRMRILFGWFLRLPDGGLYTVLCFFLANLEDIFLPPKKALAQSISRHSPKLGS